MNPEKLIINENEPAVYVGEDMPLSDLNELCSIRLNEVGSALESMTLDGHLVISVNANYINFLKSRLTEAYRLHDLIYWKAKDQIEQGGKP